MDEGEAYKECHSYNVSLKVFPKGEWAYLMTLIYEARSLQSDGTHYHIDDIPMLEAAKKRILHKLDKLGEYLDAFSDESTTSWTDDCMFKGLVDIQYGEGLLFWECPVCGTEHEEEMEDLRP
jgi:hypothetical protein